MSQTLMLYSTTDGHTLEICHRLKSVLEGEALAVTLVSIADAPGIDPEAFDRIVIGASIRYGRHSRAIVDFINRHVTTLEAKPSAFFSVNLVARKPAKRQPDTNPYLRKFLRRIAWRPQTLAVFAGKLDYPSYTAFDRAVIRLIMWMTGGPTDPKTVVDFTDWEQVEAFGRELAKG
jgi:menaquinone-dependent protoporphyrinogen oxidase